MNFENKFDNINWSNSGAQPSENLQSKGFEVGYKPSAGVFNWFWSKVMKAITEIQAKLTTSDDTTNNHIKDKNNPHGVTASQVGLGNVDNTADADKPVSTAQATAIATAEKAGTTAQANLTTHTNNKSNPHGVTAEQIGLGNVDNTADSEKSVKFASEAGVGRKVENALTVRFKGGSTEGTNLWTYNGSTGKSINITPEKIGARPTEKPNIVVNAVREVTTDGKELYVVTDSNITELYNGLEITIIPNERNTTTSPRLKINDFADNGIRLALSSNYAATTTVIANYFQVDRPITLKYHSELSLGVQGQGAWLFADRTKTSAQDLYGTVPITSGGTGADTAEEARENLGVAPAVEDTTYSGCYYRMVDGEKEWINPPMKKEFEYRTTERFNQKPVYIVCSEIPDIEKGSTRTRKVGWAAGYTAIEITGTFNSNGVIMPLGLMREADVYMGASQNGISIRNGFETPITVNVYIKYIKE